VGASIEEPGTYASAIQTEPAARWRRHVVRLKRLDDTERRLRQLQRDIEDLKGKTR
jgi:UDP-3-O-[3-hydroxymyristoyl] glucosamine N-acyltransferase